MSGTGYSALRILTKNKTRIISLDPKDIAVDGCCVYAYPRNKAFEETEMFNRTVLAEYSSPVYAMEAILQIYLAISAEKVSYVMPDEETLDPLLVNRRKKNMEGVRDAVVNEEIYKESILTDTDGDGELLSVYGRMEVEDAGTMITLEMCPVKGKEEFNFFVYGEGRTVLEKYENVLSKKTFFTSRYNVFLNKMYLEAKKRLLQAQAQVDGKGLASGG